MRGEQSHKGSCVQYKKNKYEKYYDLFTFNNTLYPEL